MKAFLILEDGTVFEGASIGSSREVISEIVFNTSMTGYLEVLTDPSYAGQAVAMTYPLIGNSGICYEDMESLKPWPSGYIVRELSRIPSNFRSEDTIQNFLEANQISGISGIDTRALTKILREKGTMNGMITTNEAFDLAEVISRVKDYKVGNRVKETSCAKSFVVQPEELTKEKKKVALLDLGVRKSIIKALTVRGCEVTVYPSNTTAKELLAGNTDGLVVSNGPGNPKENIEVIEEVRKLYETETPILAIGLGHQLLALATGGDTHQLKCGHGGSNYPVRDLETGRVYITAQNHGYVVDTDSLNPEIAVPAFTNVNDETNEGLRYIGKKIVSVQHYPEVCPSPQNSSYLFDRFMKMMEEKTNA